MNSKTALIRRASLSAIVGNALLALIKIITGISASSLAVIGDGIDSSTDVVIALMTLLVAGIIARPADKEHPWGHGRAETIATSILSFLLFFAGAQLVFSSLRMLLSGAERSLPGMPALIVTGVSILGKLLLAFNQYYYGRKAASPMIIANAKNMAFDVCISAAVLLGLSLSILLSLDFLDSLLALFVGLWVIKAAFGIFMETNQELMDGTKDTELYGAVFAAVHSIPGTFHPHKARMRRIAGLWDIDIDIEVDPEMSVRDAHSIACQVEKAIKERVDGVYDIVVHIEPVGEAEKHEKESYGLSEESVLPTTQE